MSPLRVKTEKEKKKKRSRLDETDAEDADQDGLGRLLAGEVKKRLGFHSKKKG